MAAWVSCRQVLLTSKGYFGAQVSRSSRMSKVDKDAALGAGKQGQKALVSWLSGFTAWDLRQARSELSRWIGPRPWQVPSTEPTIVPMPDLEVSSTSSTVRPPTVDLPAQDLQLGAFGFQSWKTLLLHAFVGHHPEADRVPIQTCMVGLLPNVLVTLTFSGILARLAAATI